MKKASCLLHDAALSIHPSISADIVIPLPSGEACKTREVKMQIEDILLSKAFGKEGSIIAYGGGATLDVAGFVAATYMRGVSLTVVPTTLLAMVDASVGGKNGINTRHGKNTLGSIYKPERTLLLYDLLSTLPEKEYYSGVAEIIKLGAVYDPSFLTLSYSISEASYFVPLARAAKEDIVTQDTDDAGYRRVLNFGHTIGHAVERRDALPHGHAIAFGMLVEAYYSVLKGSLPCEDYTHLKSVLSLYPFMQVSPLPFETLVPYLSIDKKSNRIIVLKALGNPVPFEGEFVDSIDYTLLEEAYEHSCCTEKYS